jgi:hypothetical protein
MIAPSQMDHPGLMGSSSMAAEAVGNVKVSPEYFAVRLAQAAMDCSYMLSRFPHEVMVDVVP